MLSLVPLMLEKVGILIILAFLLSRIKSFRHIVQTDDHKVSEKLMLIMLFGSFGIISNYTGIEIQPNSILQASWLSEIDAESALANTRVMGIVIGGIFGGPVVGMGAGLIAGVQRYTLGGFTAFSCSISTILAGVVAGYLGRNRKLRGKRITALYAVVMGMTLEAMQMLIILITARPFELSWNLVQVIGLPMIFVNGFGTLLFMFIIQSMMREEARVRASQTNLAFQIAEQTLPFFRQGLNTHSCQEISGIMLNLTHADAVAVTNKHLVLAHVGAASDHHVPKSKPETGLTRRVLDQGEISIARTKGEISCCHKRCPLTAAIVLPLKVKDKIVGTLKMYYTDPEKLDTVQQQLAEGLANLFSTQLELAEAERQAKLLKDAEIKALQAQIHPHFLFNSINTISALCRTDVNKARKLLLQLASFFRGNLQGARQMLIPLVKELENVKSYLSLEQTRFPNRYSIDFQIETEIENVLIPPFTLQPLVENAIHYAFPRSKRDGKVMVRIFLESNYLKIIVADNGKGISEEQIAVLGKKIIESKKGNGTAIFNISERLKGIYDNQASLKIESQLRNGTTITISIPQDRKGVFEQDAEAYIVDDEPLARDELKYLLSRSKQVEIIGESDGIEDATVSISTLKPDLVFLDIEFDEDSGLDLAKKLEALNPIPAIVFATAYDEYALQAFELNAVDYILKPFDENRIQKTLEKITNMKKWGNMSIDFKSPINNDRNGKMAVLVEEKFILIAYGDIIHLESSEGKCTIKTMEQAYKVSEALVVLEKKLKQSQFFRVHRSYIVNLDHIVEIEPWFNSTYNLIMKDGSKVPVSRTYVKGLKYQIGL